MTGRGKEIVEARGSGGIKTVAKPDRFPHDFYPTPESAAMAFVIAEEWRLRDFPLIWEPAAGDGAFVDVLEREGLKVHASDKIDRGRGYQIQPLEAFRTAPAKAMATNPPFSLCNDLTWLRSWDLLQLDYMALLLPLEFFASDRGVQIYDQMPPQRRYEMGWRVDFKAMGNPVSNHQWAVWDRKFTGTRCAIRTVPRPFGTLNVPTSDLPAPESPQQELSFG